MFSYFASSSVSSSSSLNKSQINYRLALLFVLIIGIDLASKLFVQSHIPHMIWSFFGYPYGGIGVFKDLFGIQFSIVHHTNTGAAWGWFGNYPLQLVWIRIAMIVGVIIYMLFFNKRKALNTPMTLIIAGAIANVLDFFIYGHVIDMFYFVFWGYSYPVFNIADSAIFIGISWLLLLSFWQPKEKTKA